MRDVRSDSSSTVIRKKHSTCLAHYCLSKLVQEQLPRHFFICNYIKRLLRGDYIITAVIRIFRSGFAYTPPKHKE
jgi:hypothetical protein